MRLAYLDCFAGISGDMFLGALLDAGVPPHILHDATAALHLGATLQIEIVDRSGIRATKVHVLEGDHLAEDPSHTAQPATHTSPPAATDNRPHSPQSSLPPRDAHDPLDQQQIPSHTHHPKTQHQHKTGHPHTHEPHTHEPHTHEPHTHPNEPAHSHGRSLTTIRALIQATTLAEPIKALALHAFDLLGHAEAGVHNVPVDQIHFHEVGAVDAIVDIVATSAGIHHLNQQALDQTGHPLHWHASALNVGSGMVQCAHGNFPVPAPATASLLRGLPTYAAHLEKELTTPTGAALIRALDPTFGTQPAMRVSHLGYGAGTRNPAGFPNVLRLSIGDTDTPNSTPDPADTVTVLETALDDLSPQLLAAVAERALALGALDVMLTPVIMKKGRPGTLLTVLANPADTPALEDLILRETTTLGIRRRTDHRSCLDRAHITVHTPYGPIRIKIGSLAGVERNAAPEFEDCRTAAAQHAVPLKLVQQAAIAAFRR